ncbi:MAG: FdtA/QdtA family cupin domain-containing protein [Bacteroidaceae bacterium]|nr:FdtA/QdtA family cupin domain-containing protein [Bacteroidaceae bacterium]
MPQGVELIQLPENVDERGRLSFAEGGLHIPFDVKRMFWISDVPPGKIRGGHAHWTCHEAVFPVSGSFDIEVDDGYCSRTFTMNSPSLGILIPAGIWCELRNFSPGSVCVVAASQEYDATGYANDYDSWKHKITHP